MKLANSILIVITIILAGTANAQTCQDNISSTTPDSRFTDNGNGTVTDKQTNLIWMRCALGQTWDGQICTGDAVEYTWQQALQAADGYAFANNSTWRVPSVKELASIVELACYDPAINLTIFPQAPSYWFWTVTPDVIDSRAALDVYFSFGGSSDTFKSNDLYVRLVHSDSN